MRLCVEAFAAKASVKAEFVDLGGDVEERFGAEEEAFAGAVIEGKAEGAGERVGVEVAIVGAALEVAAAAEVAEAELAGHGFERGGFAAAVFADEEGGAGGEAEGGEGLDCGDGERVGGGVGDAVAEEVGLV